MWWHGRAVVDLENLDAFAISDRSGFLFNHGDLQWQYEWRGNQLQNLWILVPESELDTPQEQFRPVFLPPDPVPVLNPRPPFWAQQEAQAPGATSPANGAPDDEVTP